VDKHITKPTLQSITVIFKARKDMLGTRRSAADLVAAKDAETKTHRRCRGRSSKANVAAFFLLALLAIADVLQVDGAIDATSTLVCGTKTQDDWSVAASRAKYVRVSEAILCTVTFKTGGSAVTGAIAEVSFGTCEGNTDPCSGATAGVLAADAGSMTFELTSPSTILAKTVGAKIVAKTKDGNGDPADPLLAQGAQGSYLLEMVGTPTKDSTLVCTYTGQVAGTARIDQAMTCTITIKGRDGSNAVVATTGLEDDFAAPHNTGGVSLSAIADNVADLTEATFSITAPDAAGKPFHVGGKLADDTLFAEGIHTYVVLGKPTAAASTVVCTGDTTGTNRLRIDEEATCVITPKDSGGLTVALPADFSAQNPAVVSSTFKANTFACVDGSATGCSEIKFALNKAETGAAGAVGDEIVVTPKEGANAFPSASAAKMKIIGTPTEASEVVCVGDETSDLLKVVANEVVTCTITVKDGAGATDTTTGLGSDFAITQAGGTSLSLISDLVAVGHADEGKKFKFTVKAPSDITQAFTITAKLADNTVFVNGGSVAGGAGVVTMDVYGRPGRESTMVCTGAAPGSITDIRKGAVATCIVSIKNAAGVTSGLPAHFSSPLSDGVFQSTGSGGPGITAVANKDDKEMTFLVTAPAAAGSAFTVTGRVLVGSASKAFYEAVNQLEVIGTPDAKSTLSCVGETIVSASGSFMTATGDKAVCTIAIKDSNGAVTTGFVEDFVDPDFSISASDATSTGAIVAVNGVKYTLNTAKTEATFKATTVAAVGDSLTIRAKLSSGLGNALVGTAVTKVTIIGSPEHGHSTLTCVGATDGLETNVRVSEVVTCTIKCKQTSNSAAVDTTCIPEQFNLPTVVPATSDVSGYTRVEKTAANGAPYDWLTFTLSAPSATGVAFTIKVTIGSGQDQVGIVDLGGAKILGNPDASSTLACVGAVSGEIDVRTSEVANCKITVKSNGAATTGGIADYAATPDTVGGTGTPSLAINSGNNEVSFSYTAPSTAGSAFSITGLMADNAPFTQGAHDMVVVGQPQAKSTVVCTSDSTKSQKIRQAEEATCYITVMDATPTATTGFPSDFPCDANTCVTEGTFKANSLVEPGGAKSGGRMKFTVTSTGNVGATVTVTPVVLLNGNNVDFETAETLLIIGTPTDDSDITCQGDTSGASGSPAGKINVIARESETVTCTIAIKQLDAGSNVVSTSGLASDFLSGTVAGATEVSSLELVLDAQGDETNFASFTMTAPASRATTFSVKSTLANGNAITNAGNDGTTAISFQMIGIPDAKSQLSCSNDGTVLIGATVTCTITIKDAGGVATTGLKGDFGTAVTVPSNAVKGALVDNVNSYAQVTFTVKAPATAGAAFSVLGRILDGTPFNEGAQSYVVVGKPQAQSTIICTGDTTGSQLIRIDELFTCFITARNADSSVTTAYATDFPTADFASDKCKVNTDTNGYVEVTGAAAGEVFKIQGGKCDEITNTVVGNTVTMTAKVTVAGVDTALAGAGETLLIVGTPTAASIIHCEGSTTNDDVKVRESETVTCIITVKDGSGATTGLTSDFSTGTINGATEVSGITEITSGSLASTATAAHYTFTMTAPASRATTFDLVSTVLVGGSFVAMDHDVNGDTAGGTGGTKKITFAVIGVPSTFSVIDCFGAKGSGEPVRKGETVTCEITCKDASDTATTCLAADFDDITTVGGGTKGTMAAKDTNNLIIVQTIVAPGTAGAQFLNTGNMNGGTDFRQGAQSQTVVGLPTTDSTITCLGKTYGSKYVRIDEKFQCFIAVKDGSGVTTAFPADFGSPVITNGAFDVDAYGQNPNKGLKEQADASSGSTMVFEGTPTGGTAIGSKITVQGVLSAGSANFAAAFDGLNIIGKPDEASTISCVGDDSGTIEVRTGEVVTCTITAKTTNGATRGLAGDFSTGTIVGGTSVTAITDPNFGDEGDANPTFGQTFTFQMTAPSAVKDASGNLIPFTIVAALSTDANKLLDHDTNGDVAGGTGGTKKITFVVAGRPDATSTVACVGPQNFNDKLRAGDAATCTITPKTNGVETTGTAADFTTAVTEGSSPSSPVVPTNGDGTSLVFTVTAPTGAGGKFTIVGRVKINGASVRFGQGAITMNLIGTPNKLSTMSCSGKTTPGAFVEHSTNEKAVCIISVKDANGAPTTGFASDFTTPDFTGGSLSGSIAAQSSDTEMIFEVTRSGIVGTDTFGITGKLTTGPTLLDDGEKFVEVVGTPTDASVVACTGDELNSASIVRTAEKVTCTLTCKDSNGKTTCLVSDFLAPVVVGGSGTSAFSRNAGDASTNNNKVFTEMEFTVTAPPVLSEDASFTIQIKLADQSQVGTHSFQSVIGRPSAASEMVCDSAGADLTARYSEELDCTITIKDGQGATTGLKGDFDDSATVGGTGTITLTDSSNHQTITHKITAPNAAGKTFTVTGKLKNGPLFSEGAQAYTVVGKPTAASTVVCTGDTTGIQYVRIGEVATCIINVRDDATATTAYPADYPDAVVTKGKFNEDGNGITVVGGGDTGSAMTFKIGSYDSNSGAVGDTVTVAVNVLSAFDGSTGKETSNSLKETLVIVGVPHEKSTIVCVGDETANGLNVRESEEVTCKITVKDSTPAATSGLLSDFKLLDSNSASVIAGATDISSIGFHTDTNNQPISTATASVMTFTMTAPAKKSTPFTIEAELTAGNKKIDHGTVAAKMTMVMWGRPGRESLLACVGAAPGGANQVRAGAKSMCTITVKDSASATTGQVADWAVATTTGGTSVGTPAVPTNGDGSKFEFEITAPATAGATFSVTGNVKIAGSTFTFLQGAISQQVIGTPSVKSTMKCVGKSTPGAYVRYQENAVCTITIIAADNSATTGFAADFTDATLVGCTKVGSIVAQAGNTEAVFEVAGTAAVSAAFSVHAQLSAALAGSGSSDVGVKAELEVIGTPTGGTLVCVGEDLGSDATVRTSERVTCTFNPTDANSAKTTCLVSDFDAPKITGGTSLSSVSIEKKTDAGTYSQLSFTVDAPSTSGASFVIKVHLKGQNTAAATKSFTNVIGHPSSASVMACAGAYGTHVRFSEELTCTITCKKDGTPNSVATTCIKDDFGTSVTVGGTGASALASSTNFQTVTHKITAPSTVGATFLVTGAMEGGTPFSEGATDYVVVGQPTTASTMECYGSVTKLNKVRTTETATCIITVKDDSAATTGFPSDFEEGNVKPAVVKGAFVANSMQEVDGADSGTHMKFTVNGFATSAAIGDTVSVTGNIKDGSSSGASMDAETMIVIGTPHQNSILTCVGKDSGTLFVREAEDVNCIITVFDDAGTPAKTTGLTTDFVTGIIAGATEVGSIADTSGSDSPKSTTTESYFKFSMTAPSDRTTAFTIKSTLAAGTAIQHGQAGGGDTLTFAVLGIPSALSTLSCKGSLALGQPVRIGETLTCTITIKNADNAATTGLETDFGASATTGGTNLGSNAKSSNYLTVTHTIKAPTTAGSSFLVTGKLADGTLFNEGAKSFVVVGQPTTASTLVCVGQTSGTNLVTLSEKATCTITAKDANGLTTGYASDFVAPAITGTGTFDGTAGISVSGGGDSGEKFTFVVGSFGNAVGETVKIKGKVAGGGSDVFTTAEFTLTIVGTPTTDSAVACVGDVTNSVNVRTSEAVTCTITVKDASGTTGGSASDFSAPTVVGGTGVTAYAAASDSTASATKLEFKMAAPPGYGNTFTVENRLVNGVSKLTPNKITLTVFGRPDKTCTLACVAANPTSATKIRAGGTATCTITVKELTAATTGQIGDFDKAVIVGGTTATQPAGTSDAKTLTFTVPAPSTVGASFSITGRVIIGSTTYNFLQGAYAMAVMGTPDAKSTLDCVGKATPGAYVRKGENAVCTITIKDANGDPTTGFASDYGTTDVTGGAVASGGLTSITSDTEVQFEVTPTADVGEDFKVRALLADDQTVVDNAATTIVVIGTPSTASILACTGETDSSATFVRISEVITCIITCRFTDSGGTIVPTTCLESDFKSPESVNGISISGYTDATTTSGTTTYTTLTFTLTSPSTTDPTNGFSVTAKLSSDGSPLTTKTFSDIRAIPDETSTLTCVGSVSTSTHVRASEKTDCTYVIKQDGSPVTGATADFKSVTTGGTGVTAFTRRRRRESNVFVQCPKHCRRNLFGHR